MGGEAAVRLAAFLGAFAVLAGLEAAWPRRRRLGRMLSQKLRDQAGERRFFADFCVTNAPFGAPCPAPFAPAGAAAGAGPSR